MSTVLWETGDIAAELGVPGSTVSNWAYRGLIPGPAYITSRGLRLWSEAEAWAIIADRTEHVETRRRHQLAVALKP